MTLPFGLGALHVTAPWALVALLVLPLFLLPVSPEWRAWLAAACRTLAAATIVFVLAGAHVEVARPGAGACLVAAIDVSASVQGAARATARDYLARVVPALGTADVLGTIAFAGRPRVLVHPTGGGPPLSAFLPAEDDADLDPGDTDLAAALTRAAPLCPEDRQAAILLFSDGNETEGSALAEVALAEPHIPVYPIVPAPAALPTAAVRRLLVPRFAPARTAVPIEAVVESRTPISAAIALDANGEGTVPAPFQLPAGMFVLPLPLRFAETGQVLVEARLLLAPTEPQAPGPAAAALTVGPPLRVVVVSEHESPVVAAALSERGMDVELVPPGAFAARVPGLDDVHLVVLDDVASAALGRRALEALREWVAHGGALVVTGGEHLFGDAGFVGSALERVLPVELQSQAPEPKEREPIALYLLIDRSNSMGYATGAGLGFGDKMEYAKRAALAVLDQLGPSDQVGAIAFDSLPYELGPLTSVARGRAALEDRVRALQYGGGTDFKDALEIALRSLLESGVRVRHLILLTDGDTNRRADDHAQVIAAYAQSGISITTIRIGSDTVNVEFLNAISRMTGGEFHHVENLRALPQLMIRDTQRLMDVAADRKEARAQIAEPGTILAGFGEDDLPPVARWAVTRPRPGAEVRLFVDAGGRRDPVLATWQYELGRVAVLPLDFQSGAAGWAAWPGFAKLWAQVALWAAPPALPSEHHLEARRLRDSTFVRVDTLSDDPGPFVLRIPPAGDVVLSPLGPRRFGAAVPGLEPGVHPAVLRSGSAEERVELAVPRGSGNAREYRAVGPNLHLLERLAAATGGAMGREPGDVLAARPGVRRETVSLAGVLVPFVMLLVLADVGLRRWGRRAPGGRLP